MRKSEHRLQAVKTALEILRSDGKVSRVMKSELAKLLLNFELEEKKLIDSKHQRAHEVEMAKLRIQEVIARRSGNTPESEAVDIHEALAAARAQLEKEGNGN